MIAPIVLQIAVPFGYSPYQYELSVSVHGTSLSMGGVSHLVILVRSVSLILRPFSIWHRSYRCLHQYPALRVPTREIVSRSRAVSALSLIAILEIR